LVALFIKYFLPVKEFIEQLNRKEGTEQRKHKKAIDVLFRRKTLFFTPVTSSRSPQNQHFAPENGDLHLSPAIRPPDLETPFAAGHFCVSIENVCAKDSCSLFS
jgi:hypothetical protein